MGLLTKWVGSGLRASTQADEFLRGADSVHYLNAAQQPVTPELALRLSDVYSCVAIISRAVGMLPKRVYQNVPTGGKKVAGGHPLADLIAMSPNAWQTAMDWFSMMQVHVELRGNAYSEIIAGPRGFADQLRPIHPDRVTVLRVPDTGRLLYRVAGVTGEPTRTLTQDEMFHLRNLSLNGYVGLSTIEAAAETVGAGLAAQEYASRFFANDARPGIVIEGAKFKSDADFEKFRQSWQASQTGANRHKAGILPEGLTLKEVGVKNTDAQLIESRKLTRSQIAAMFGVPLFMLGETDKVATYASVEQFGIQFVTHCILPRVIMWEQALNNQLILAPQVYFVKFILQALLRGDTASRYEAYAKARQWGWFSTNDIRELEDMNPIPGGDDYLVPANMNVRGTNGQIIVTAQPKPPAGAPSADSRLVPIAIAASERCVRKEVAWIRKQEKLTTEGLQQFYGEHSRFMSEVLAVPVERLSSYCGDHIMELGCGPVDEVLTRWEAEAAQQLSRLALEA